MLDFFFENDPLKEMERDHQQKLEQALKIRKAGDEDAYLTRMEELREMEVLMEEFKDGNYHEEVEGE